MAQATLLSVVSKGAQTIGLLDAQEKLYYERTVFRYTPSDGLLRVSFIFDGMFPLFFTFFSIFPIICRP